MLKKILMIVRYGLLVGKKDGFAATNPMKVLPEMWKTPGK
jgi:hypothetical protein